MNNNLNGCKILGPGLQKYFLTASTACEKTEVNVILGPLSNDLLSKSFDFYL